MSASMPGKTCGARSYRRTVLPKVCRHSAISRPTYPAPMIATRSTPPRTDILKRSAGDVRKFRHDARSDQEPIVGNLDSFSGIRAGAHDPLARGNDLFDARVVKDFDATLFLKRFGRIRDKVFCPDQL